MGVGVGVGGREEVARLMWAARRVRTEERGPGFDSSNERFRRRRRTKRVSTENGSSEDELDADR